ncbi:sigma-70 family RNA polymerase sigma factor [Pirellulales bacterium]|nr:sigma-70 family RNA polymerase sigma factor [Pirellulales bacterium]
MTSSSEATLGLPSTSLRQHAMQLLDEIDGLGPLIHRRVAALINDEDNDDRLFAVNDIYSTFHTSPKQFLHPSLVTLLLFGLDDDDHRIRHNTLTLLRRLVHQDMLSRHDRDHKIIPSCLCSIMDASSPVRYFAARWLMDNFKGVCFDRVGLRPLQRTATIQQLIDALADDTTVVREAAIWGLGHIPSDRLDRKTIEKIFHALVDAIADRNAAVRLAAASALPRATWDVIFGSPFFAIIDDFNRLFDTIARTLSVAFDHDDPNVRTEIANGIGALPYHDVTMNRLIAALDDDHLAVRVAAASSIYDVLFSDDTYRSALEPIDLNQTIVPDELVPTLIEHPSHSNPTIREYLSAALRSLHRFGDDDMDDFAHLLFARGFNSSIHNDPEWLTSLLEAKWLKKMLMPYARKLSIEFNEGVKDLIHELRIELWRGLCKNPSIGLDPERYKTAPGWLKGWLVFAFLRVREDLQRRKSKHICVSNDKLEENTECRISDRPDGFIRSEVGDTLLKAIEQLNTAEREVVYLVYLQGLEMEEAARALEISMSALWKRHQRAARSLRTLLSNRSVF